MDSIVDAVLRIFGMFACLWSKHNAIKDEIAKV
jgi:hypothetical protein